MKAKSHLYRKKLEVVQQRFEPTFPIEELVEHPDNPRSGDVGAIFSSLERHGFYGAVIVQASTGHVLAGNHRLKAARQGGLATLPAFVLDVDDDEAKRILLADNRSSDLASMDDPKLLGLLTELLQTPDALEGTLYSAEDMDELHKLLNGDAQGDIEEIPSQFDVMVKCTDEAMQRKLMERLIDEGYECKAVLS